MRVLCLIMVGAFLLSIAIADNGNSMRLHPRNVRQQRRVAPVNGRAFHLPPKARYPPRRVHRDALPKAGHAEKSAHLDHRPSDREAKSLYQSNSMMILEPVQQPATSSWSDWIPDFFGDDPPEGPGVLIGPIDFPGLSRELYIRQKEPLDDDTNHVVVHLINRDPVYASEVVPVSRHPQVQQLQHSNHVDSSPKDHYQSDSSQISAGNFPPDYDYEKSQYSSKVKNGNPWNDSVDDVIQMPNEKPQSKLSVALLEHSSSGTPNIVWSRPVDRQDSVNARSMNLVSSESIAPVEAGGSPLKSSIPIPLAANASAANNPRRRHVHPSNTRAPSESVRPAAVRPQRNHAADEIPRLDAPANHLDEITVDARHRRLPANHASRVTIGTNNDSFAEALARSQRNSNATGQSGGKVPSRQKNKLPEGALHVVPAPNLRDSKGKGSSGREAKANATKGDEIMQRIMSMTSETWKEDEYSSSNKIDEPVAPSTDDESDIPDVAESQNIERRIDLDLTSEDKSNEAEYEMKEAVKKIMSTYALWRHKAVSTKFLKELEAKKKKKT